MKLLQNIKLLTNYISSEIPPGPKILKLKHIINFQKGFTSIYVLILMNYFDNFTKTAYLYLSLHGTYGIVWLLKDLVIPDKSWEKKTTLLSSLSVFILVLGLYWVSPFLIIKNREYISNSKMTLSIFIHTIGCVLMMASDTQKFFEIRLGKKLVNDGWFKNSRNTNYLGEMMIYFTYALIGVSYVPYFILLFIWSILFFPNMINKDIRIAKKTGGKKYINSSNLLIPKLNI